MASRRLPGMPRARSPGAAAGWQGPEALPDMDPKMVPCSVRSWQVSTG